MLLPTRLVPNKFGFIKGPSAFSGSISIFLVVTGFFFLFRLRMGDSVAALATVRLNSGMLSGDPGDIMLRGAIMGEVLIVAAASSLPPLLNLAFLRYLAPLLPPPAPVTVFGRLLRAASLELLLSVPEPLAVLANLAERPIF